MRESFIFYKSFYDSIKELAPEEQVQIYNAIFEYEFNKNEVELKGVCKSIFTLIIPQLQANDKRYENGKKGGRPKTKTKPKQNQKITKIKPNVNDNVNVNVNDNVNNNSSSNNIYEYIEENFGRMLSPIEYQEISTWENNELTRYAIKDAVLNGKCNIKYISKILENYKKNSIITVHQAQEATNRYKESKKYKTANDRANEVYERFLAKGES